MSEFGTQTSKLDEAQLQRDAEPWRCHGLTFDLIYRDNCAAVRGLAMQVCGSSMAEDVTQDVFMRLWRAPRAFDPARGSLRAYLVVMARHVAVDRLRSQGARRAREERVDRFGHDSPDPVDHGLLRDDQAAVVAAALETLPRREREAIVGAFFGGRSYRETAVALGLPEGTVKTRIRRGLHRLHATLELSSATSTDPTGPRPRLRLV